MILPTWWQHDILHVVSLLEQWRDFVLLTQLIPLVEDVIAHLTIPIEILTDNVGIAKLGLCFNPVFSIN
jgi:hypothetical protein